MRLPKQLRTAAAAIARAVHTRTPTAAEWAGLAAIAYGVSRFSFAAGVIVAGVFLVAEAMTTAIR